MLNVASAKFKGSNQQTSRSSFFVQQRRNKLQEQLQCANACIDERDLVLNRQCNVKNSETGQRYQVERPRLMRYIYASFLLSWAKLTTK